MRRSSKAGKGVLLTSSLGQARRSLSPSVAESTGRDKPSWQSTFRPPSKSLTASWRPISTLPRLAPWPALSAVGLLAGDTAAFSAALFLRSASDPRFSAPPARRPGEAALSRRGGGGAPDLAGGSAAGRAGDCAGRAGDRAARTGDRAGRAGDRTSAGRLSRGLSVVPRGGLRAATRRGGLAAGPRRGGLAALVRRAGPAACRGGLLLTSRGALRGGSSAPRRGLPAEPSLDFSTFTVPQLSSCCSIFQSPYGSRGSGFLRLTPAELLPSAAKAASGSAAASPTPSP